MDTIDFNKHDIDIFINLANIVRYGRHWDESCNEWRYDTINYIFWRQLSQCEIAPIWRLQKIHTVAFWVHVITIKKILSLIEFFVQVRSKITQSKQKFSNPFLRFFENSSDKLRIVWRNEKGHIGNTWRHVLFYQKGHGAQKKGHGAVPFYFSLDKTLFTVNCYLNELALYEYSFIV
jgi:hypothetical protein